METIKKNLLQIKEEIAPYTPNIIAVTKYYDESKIIDAYSVGLRDFGESRVIEASEKIQRLPEEIRENSRFHLIGHLQTNKVNKAVKNFDYIHSIDSVKLAKAVSDEALKEGKIQKVLLQVNNAEEEQKYGFSQREIYDAFKELLSLKGIEVVGLMNMAPYEASESDLKELFEEIVSIRDGLKKRFGCKLEEISMGMSGDYKIATVAGATMIRIGRKLFS